MITVTFAGGNDWNVMNDGVLVGYIRRTDDGEFEARKPRSGDHKGGISPLVGIYPTQDAAEQALVS